MARGFIQFLQSYTPDELRFIVRILHDFTETSFLKVELNGELLEKMREQSYGRQFIAWRVARMLGPQTICAPRAWFFP